MYKILRGFSLVRVKNRKVLRYREIGSQEALENIQTLRLLKLEKLGYIQKIVKADKKVRKDDL